MRRSNRSRTLLVALLCLVVVAGIAGVAFMRRDRGGFSPEAAARAVQAAQPFRPSVAAPAPDAAALVAGFTDEHVVDVPQPSALAWTPDGRMLVTTQPGWLYVVQNDVLAQTPALNLTDMVCSNGEQGMVGIAVDPDFATTKYIYIFYSFKKFDECARRTDTSAVSRVSRFVLEDDNTVDPATEAVLIDNVPSFGIMHVAGDLQFGKDGFLYVAIGDGACDYTQDSGCYGENNASRYQNALLGKVLRISRDGGIPPTNPWLGPDSARCNVEGRTDPGRKCQETFAWGLRNPFRLAFDPDADTTRFRINDVGENDREEIDDGIMGADYGWNLREGDCLVTDPGKCDEPTPPGTTAPIYTYDHTTACGAISGAAFVPRGVWPAPYDGAYLFADYRCGQVFRLAEPTDGPWSAEPLMFGAGLLSAVDLRFGPAPDGMALYYTTFLHDGQVRRIRATDGGPPVADQAFADVWQRTELPALAPVNGSAAQPMLWGEQPLATGVREAYEEAPDGMRLVQYWAKGRMEIDADAPDNVSFGQLVVEMVSGRVQTGVDTWEERAPADEPIVGDAAALNPDAPTYSSLGSLAYPTVATPSPRRPNATLTTVLNEDGTTSDDPALASYAMTIAGYDDELGHNIAQVFADFLQRRGVVYHDDAYASAPLFDGNALTGRPIGEPYWVRTLVEGEEKLVLVQAFERRVLTYTPGRAAGLEVESANVGQHYLRWRYHR